MTEDQKAGYIYQSIPFLKNQVFKCAGIVTTRVLDNGMTHKDYFMSLYRKTSPILDDDAMILPFDEHMQQPDKYRVLFFEEYKGDRINEDGTLYTGLPL